MPAKVEIFENELECRNGKWSCADQSDSSRYDPVLAAMVQELCDDHWQNFTDYLVEIDQQSAQLVVATIDGSRIIEITQAAYPDGAANGVCFAAL